MLELGAGADILRAVGALYWGLIGVLIALALWLPKRGWQKALGVVAVLVVFLGPAVNSGLKQAQEASERKVRYEKAKALFDQRCTTAGEFIYQMVEDVEGVYLMKLRPRSPNFGAQFVMDDPYGSDVGGMGLISTFLRQDAPPDKESPSIVKGYHYVVANDIDSGKLYRFTGSWVATRKKDPTAPRIQEELKKNPNFDLNIYDFVLQKAPPTPLPRYGVTWDDISTREEREYWIAGSSLRVIDLQTNKVIAERVGYMFDRAQGSKAGNRSPWLFAANTACPSFRFVPNAPRISPDSHWQIGQTYRFVAKVLKPKQ